LLYYIKQIEFCLSDSLRGKCNEPELDKKHRIERKIRHHFFFCQDSIFLFISYKSISFNTPPQTTIFFFFWLLFLLFTSPSSSNFLFCYLNNPNIISFLPSYPHGFEIFSFLPMHLGHPFSADN